MNVRVPLLLLILPIPLVGQGSCPGEVEGPCPPEMAQIEGYCIDRWEAHLVGQSPYAVPAEGVADAAEGVVPQGYISGDVAQLACEAAAKRLCSLEEWLRACQGPGGSTYPYGDVYVAGACNDTYPGGHPVVDYFGTSTGVWDAQHMNDPGINQQPDTVDPAGANPGCVSDEGVYDLHGNLHEWIADPAGTFKGGFYADASINGAGCTYTTTAHGVSYHDYSTGFRCCRDVELTPGPSLLSSAGPAPSPPARGPRRGPAPGRARPPATGASR